MNSSAGTRPAVVAPSLEAVAEAWRIIQPALWRFPLLECPALDELTGYQTLLKAENLQRVGSYKIRGAYYKLSRLRDLQSVRKVVAASAGNHAQGVAYSAHQLGMKCLIVMPERAALPKRRATEHYGAELLLRGANFDEALAYAKQIARDQGWEFISPFNDLEIITGQATLGWELREEMRADPPDAVLIPVGGGGLIAGVAAVLKQTVPGVRVIGVQSNCAPAFVESWKAYKSGAHEHLPLDIPTQQTIADGVRVRQPGDLCWRICRDLVDGAVAVDDTRVYRAILFLLENAKLVAEGAGALGIAALLDRDGRQQLAAMGLKPGARVVLVITGGNIDSQTLQHVIEKSLAVTGRSLALRVRIHDEPGQLGRILEFLRKKRAVVLDFRRSWQSSPLISDMADMEILIETEDERHGQEVLDELAKEAKAHNFELLLASPAAEGRAG